VGASYDAIVVGGGHNGLVTASYLQRAGLKTLVLERASVIGGGLNTEERIPGFKHNLHATNLAWMDYWPQIQDLELRKFGLKLAKPEVLFGLPLKSGRALVLYRDIKKSAKSIESFSKKDATNFEKYAEDFREFWESVVVPMFYSPPIDPDELQKKVKRSVKNGEEILRMMKMKACDLANELFEDDTVRALTRYISTIPCEIDDYEGSGLSLIGVMGFRWRGYQIVVGGSNNLAKSIEASFRAAGGEVRLNSDVAKIEVKDGRAIGISLEDGTIIGAKRAVISAVNAVYTLVDLVGAEYVDRNIMRKIRSYKWSEWALFGVHMALNEPPKHTASKSNPDVDMALKYFCGIESTSDIDRLWRDIRAGKLSDEPVFGSGAVTLFDPTQAPPGKHTAYIWTPSAYSLKDGGPSRWLSIKDDYEKSNIAKWAEYAPNLNDSNIIDSFAYTPYDIPITNQNMVDGDFNIGRFGMDQNGVNRPIPELSGYRTPIAGLYLCGSSSHPGGSILGAPGYNAAGIIVEDLNLKKWWSLPHWH
jgi:phytoene dehydrogenase-like protein